MKYTFKFKLFGSKVQMFSEGQMGIVVEKEPQVVCVYGTDEKHANILCAIPLCSPKYLKDAEYVVDFGENGCAKVSAGVFEMVIDFEKQKCAINQAMKCYGSDSWGQDVQVEWGKL